MSETSAVAGWPSTYESRLDRLAANKAARAALDADDQQILAALAEDVPSWMTDADARVHTAKGWVREEVGAVLKVSPHVAGDRIRTAIALVRRFTATLALLASDQISFWHARAMVIETAQLDEAAAARVEAKVLPRAPQQSLPEFLAALRRAVKAAAPADAEARHQAALAQRRIVITHDGDGMAEIWSKVPSEGAADIEAAIEDAVTEIRQPGDIRTLDQLRADAFLSLARRRTDNAADGQPVGPSVHVTMTLASALDEADEPAELDGVGPITAEHARRIAFAAGATWRRLVTDPLGRAVDLSSKAYKPPPRLRRFIQTRDHTCRFPHCKRKASRCEADHCLARSNNGQTCEHNLHMLCTRHHQMKHEAGWRVVMRKDGTTTWTSPTGRVYDVPPHEHPTDPPEDLAS